MNNVYPWSWTLKTCKLTRKYFYFIFFSSCRLKISKITITIVGCGFVCILDDDIVLQPIVVEKRVFDLLLWFSLMNDVNQWKMVCSEIRCWHLILDCVIKSISQAFRYDSTIAILSICVRKFPQEKTNW